MLFQFFGPKQHLLYCHNLFLGYSQIHFLFLKKKNWNSAVQNGTILLLPLHMQRQGKKRFAPLYFFPISFSSLAQTLKWPMSLTWHQMKKTEGTSPAGNCPVAARTPPTPVPWLDMGSRPLSPLFAYKYRKKERNKKIVELTGGRVGERKNCLKNIGI